MLRPPPEPLGEAARAPGEEHGGAGCGAGAHERSSARTGCDSGLVPFVTFPQMQEEERGSSAIPGKSPRVPVYQQGVEGQPFPP